jgi:CelD/BcsL family acetyltransferase involved in cellulose biosynthesis/GNAT superfamily N-acetyltransferase
MHFAQHVIRTVTNPAPPALLLRETNILPFDGTREGAQRATAITSLPALESALGEGLHAEWTALVAADPLASVFQTPGWCIPWYRCYADEYDPFVITVRVGGTLVGLVPMTVERATRRLLFASDTMADYRDIVSLPEHRAAVVDALIGVYLEGRFSNPLQVGFIDPASDTPQLMAAACARRGLKSLVGHQPCYRWFPPAGKPSAQKFLNWFKRQGDVSFDVIAGEEAWTRFRDAYYRQHSLRQVQAGRERAFDDPRRAALYEQLFHSTEIQPHATAFTLNGELLAGHFGFVWRDVLLLGPPSIHLEHEQRSPAVILLSWIIQNASQLGLAGFDLTIGDSDFKKRLGNQCVQLTTVEVFRSRLTYWTRLARRRVMDAAKRVVARVAGPDAWKAKVKPLGEQIAYKLARVREDGLLASIRAAVAAAVTSVFERRVGHVYAIEPGGVQAVAPKLNTGDVIEFHENRVDDLLLWDQASLTTRSDMTQAARSYARCRNTGRTLHTVVINGKLAGWGYSYYPTEPAQLTETPGATLEFEPKAVSLFDFHVVPEFRGRRIYQALLTHILQMRFAEGAVRAYITVLEANAPSRVAIERVGFRVVARNLYQRLLKRESLTPLAP